VSQPTHAADAPAQAAISADAFQRSKQRSFKTGGKKSVRAVTNRGDRVFRVVILFCVGTVLAIFVSLFFVLIDGALPAMKLFGLRFVTREGWDPVHLDFGAFPFIVGTIIVAFGSLVLAGGIGLLTAICVTELLPRRLQETVAYLIELLAFIPSVVYGLF